MSLHLIHPNSKPSFAHTQVWGLNRNHFLRNHVVAFLALNEGGGDMVVDLSGNGNDGILSTGAVWDYTNECSVNLDANDSKVLMETNNFPYAEGSISFWVDLNNSTDAGSSFSHFLLGDNSYTAHRINIIRNSIFQDVRIVHLDAGSDITYTSTIPAGRHLYTYTWNAAAGSRKFYLDSELKINSAGSTWTPDTTLTSMRLGDPDNATTNSDASYEKFIVHDKELTASEVYGLYNTEAELLHPGLDLSVFGGAAVSGFQPAWAQNSTLTQGIAGVV